MPKLLLVVNVDWFFLSHRKEIALAAQKAGWNVTIVTAETGKLKDIEALGLRTIDLKMSRSGTNIFQELRTLLFLINIYKKEKPDVVHHVGLKVILWGSLAAKCSKVKGVVNAISGLGGIFASDRKNILTEIIPKVLRYSHNRRNILCIFQNNEDWDLYVKYGIIKSEIGRYIKGSGVDLNKFAFNREPSDEKIIVILAARMIVEKGIFIFTNAANILHAKYREKVTYLLVGGLDDHPGAITKEQLESVCDGKFIRWLGYRTDVKDLLIQSHIVAFPSSYMEGLPKFLIEASAIGRPIVTCDSVGCRDVVLDGYNGYLIPTNDSEALANKLIQLIENKELRIQMGLNARRFAEENFSIDDVIKKHLDIYNELLFD